MDIWWGPFEFGEERSPELPFAVADFGVPVAALCMLAYVAGEDIMEGDAVYVNPVDGHLYPKGDDPNGKATNYD